MTAINGAPDGQRGRFWSLPPVAFFIALLAAPICVAAGAALAAIPTGVTSFIGLAFAVSVLLGAPSYVLVFGPMAWLAHLRGQNGAANFAALGLLANLLAFALALCLSLIFAPSLSDFEDIVGFWVFVHGFGLIFAPIYGVAFGAIFSALMRRGQPHARPAPSEETVP